MRCYKTLVNEYYIFISRYLVPFFFHNVFFGLLRVKIKRFLFIVILAEIPLTFSLNSIGKSFNTYVYSKNMSFIDQFKNIDFIVPFIVIMIIFLVSNLIKKNRI